MILRHIRDIDLNDLWNILRTCFPEDQLPYRDKFDRVCRDGTVFVSGDAVVIKGFAVVTSVTEGMSKIRNICVLPEFQGMGEASYLIKEIKQHCIICKDKILILDVRHDNFGAIRLYERHGFKGSRVLPDKYGPGQDGIEMETAL